MSSCVLTMRRETGVVVLLMCFYICVTVAGDITDCQGIRCENGGTLSKNSVRQCYCACTEEFTGITCKTRLEPSQWPDGPYTIPMSKYGCPELEANGWRSCTLSIVTMETVDIWKIYEDMKYSFTLNQNEQMLARDDRNETKSTHLLGPFWKNGFVLPFCTKTKHVSNKPEWPDVIDVVYQSEGLCPIGFKTGKDFSMTIPDVMAMNTDGMLPGMNIDRTENNTVYITIFTCERLNNSRDGNSDASYDQFVVPKGDGECKSMQGLEAELEKIIIDFNNTETDRNVTQDLEFKDNFITLEYCFYKKILPQEDKVKQLTGEIPEIDIMYQIPFSHGRNGTEIFVRSKLLYGIRILKTYPEMKGNYYIVTDMYGLHSYRSNTDRDNKPLFNVAEGSMSADYPWILLQLPSQHYVDSVFVALTVYWGENPENLISLSEFVNPAISVSQSEAALWNHGALSMDFMSYLFYKGHISTLHYYDTPYIYDLPTPHVTVQHQFKRATMGQYIMIHFPQHRLSEDEQHRLLSRYFNRMVGFHVLPKDKERCGRTRVLRNFQLSASTSMIGQTANSSGLYGSGWCADPIDPSPYLQVDFIFPTLISGIKIKNWAVEESTILLGVQTFNLTYGVNDEEFEPYGNMSFEIDTSQPYNTTHTFLFQRRFFARYVRLYPVPLASRACLKFELLECSDNNNGVLSMECSSVSLVVNTSTIYVSLDQPFISDNITSWTDCLETCNTMEPQCSVLEYQDNSQLCTVYRYNSTSNMRTLLEDSRINATLSTHLCLDESAVMMINDGQKQYMHRYGEGVLTSLGYPISYRGGDVILWLINIDDSMFVQIIFTNISLNVYEDTTVCEDKISISPSQFTRFRMESKNLIKQTITARSNGEAVVYWGETSAAYVAFETCELSVHPLHFGKGFRALIRQTDSSYCYGGWDMKADRAVACTQPEMFFGSPTYFDSTQLWLRDQEPQIYYVNIFGNAKGNIRYIELMITDLNIPCKKDYLQLIIDDLGDSVQKQYCTFDRPPMLYKSTLWDLSIKLFYWNYMVSSEYKENKWHGFYGNYKFVCNNETVYNWTTSVTEAPTPWDPYDKVYRTVCSDRFHSCYTMFPSLTSFQRTDKSWTRAQELCASQGQNLVSLNTEEEYLYVRLMAENYTRAVESYDYRYSYLRLNPQFTDLHIGLVRFPEGQSLVDMWLDGNPLIFSAWAVNQPSNVIDHPCTKMRLRFFSHDDNWYSQPCDDAEGSVAGYFICEKKMDNTSTSQQPYRLGNSFPSSTNVKYKTSQFQCGSGEYLSWLSVCNGIPECDDQIDELYCNYGDTCGEEEFRCSNGRCITYNKVCDNFRDCVEGEDEHCESEVELFECGDHQKVAQGVVCDGEFDCIDGTDGSNCASCHSRVLHCKGLTKNCVPHALTCDKYMECRDGADESGCSQFPIESCDDWWGLGVRDNAIVEIDGQQVQCVFNRLEDFNTETVIPLDLVLNLTQETYNYHGDSIQTHNIHMFIRVLLLMNDYRCYIAVLETYQPAVKMVRTVDGQGGVSDQVFSTYNFSSYVDLSWLKDVELNEVMGFETTLEPYKRLQYLDVTCRNRHYNSIYRLPCKGRLQAIDPRRFCLYNDDFLDLGCRTLSHLWNCEDHVCPKYYVKCPRSFCLAVSLVCDGRRHCPNGEDEENCYCEGKLHNVHVISFQQSDEEILYHFAQQFLTMTNRVSLTFVSDPQYSVHSDFGYFLHTVKLERALVTEMDYRLLSRLGTPREEAVRNTYEVLDFILTEEHEKSWLNSTSRMDLFSGHILDEDLPPFRIIVIDDIIDETMLWDVIYTSNKDAISGVMPYRVIEDKSIKGIAGTEERPEWIEIRLYDSKYLEYGGFLLFDKICQGNRSGACQNGYKCQASRKCLPLSRLCDGKQHCPHGDDERICGITCPSKCECQGYIVNCRDRNFTYADLTEIPSKARNLDMSLNPYLSNGPFQMQRETNFLTKLNLSSSGIKHIDKSSFITFPNIQILDLRNNLFTSIPKHTFLTLGSLLEIYLTGNRYLKYLDDQAFIGLTKIRSLSISYTDIEEINARPFMGLNLDLLDLSGNLKLSSVSDNTFAGLTSKSIVIENCPIRTFTADMFTGISGIEEMRTSAYKFCCIRPATVEEEKCTPSRDKFSSCEDLMRNLSQRALLWIIGLVALIGNLMVILYRVVYDRSHLKLGHGIFVTNLAVADFFMGLYLIIIAVVDQIFRDRYIWMDDYWRNSGWCTLAGILSTMSSESSIMFMCLITLDRILVIKFPFGQVRFRALSALISVGICWITVIILSVVPIIFSDYFQNEFYSKSGVCIALPLTQERYQGWLYSIMVFVGFNFTTFILIAFGQLLIYQEVQNSSKKFKHGKSSRTNDLKVARNLLLVVSTDFLCWGPVGCMGLMSIAGSSIPPTVYAWTAVLILPVNSALNPFLYTLSTVLNKNAFKPRLDEQTRLDPGELLLLKRMLGLWKFQFGQGKADKNQVQPSESLTKLDVVAIGKVALQMAHCLHLLHRIHLRMHDMRFLSHDRETESDGNVKFIVDPTLCANNKDKADDIHKLGSLVQFMIEHHKDSVNL